MPLLGLVVCGAPLAARTYDLVVHARRAQWDASVLSTAAAGAWLKPESDVSSRVTGFPMPEQAKRARPDALVVCPLTFNSASKWALGIADNRPLSLMCEALGAGIPMVAVPMVNESLWMHPAWVGHLELLQERGVVMLDPATGERDAKAVRHGTADEITKQFDPAKVFAVLSELSHGATP
ncbi:MAG: flavoprotein [Nocardioidaceae bacterium]